MKALTLLQPHEISTLKKVVAIGVVSMALVVGIGEYAVRTKPAPVAVAPTPIVVQPAPKAFNVDPKILALGAKLGIAEDQLIETKAQIGTVGTCGTNKSSTVASCYDGTIYLYPSLFEKPELVQISSLAHEYLHHVWRYKMTAEEKKTIGLELITVYNQNKKSFDGVLKNYYAGGMIIGDEEFYDELHSYEGSITDDKKLTPELLTHYRKYVPNRYVLPSYL